MAHVTLFDAHQHFMLVKNKVKLERVNVMNEAWQGLFKTVIKT